jgi:hypothetical protein
MSILVSWGGGGGLCTLGEMGGGGGGDEPPGSGPSWILSSQQRRNKINSRKKYRLPCPETGSLNVGSDWQHCKQFLIYVFPKKVLPSLYQKYEINISNQNYNIIFGIMIFSYLKRSAALDAAIQLSA